MSERATWSDIGFLSLLTATPALATDMYLSAIPTIAHQWNSSESVIGLSLVLWFVAFSIFLLVWGPISDRVGRRPVLLVGLAVFIPGEPLLRPLRYPASTHPRANPPRYWGRISVNNGDGNLPRSIRGNDAAEGARLHWRGHAGHPNDRSYGRSRRAGCRFVALDIHCSGRHGSPSP